jgi:hypothetical protein
MDPDHLFPRILADPSLDFGLAGTRSKYPQIVSSSTSFFTSSMIFFVQQFVMPLSLPLSLPLSKLLRADTFL